MAEDVEKYRLKLKISKQKSRLNSSDTAFKRKKAFYASIRKGRVYFCICCHRKLYENQVIELDDEWQDCYEKQYPQSFAKFIGPIPLRNIFLPCLKGMDPQQLSSNHVCYTCKNYLERNAMPPMSNQNNLQLIDRKNHPELNLSELEQQLIALNLIFQKIVLLPKTRMSAMKDKTVSVPVSTADVAETITKLPRTPTDASLTVVQLKRRLNYPGVHKQQLINMSNVMQALRTFIELKNPYYQNILEDKQFKERCQKTDPEGFRILFPEEDINLSDLEINSQSCDDKEVNEMEFDKSSQNVVQPDESSKNQDCEEEENEYLEKDVIAKSQFNYNRSTCFGENHPEIAIEENVNDVTQVAPGQGKIPQSILQEENIDVKSFPCLFPNGRNGEGEKKKGKVGRTRILVSTNSQR